MGRDNNEPAEPERNGRIAACLDASDLHGAATEALRTYGPAILP